MTVTVPLTGCVVWKNVPVTAKGEVSLLSIEAKCPPLSKARAEVFKFVPAFATKLVLPIEPPAWKGAPRVVLMVLNLVSIDARCPPVS
jgi:hypothetical protein